MINLKTDTIQIKIKHWDDSLRPWVALPVGSAMLPIGFGETIKQALSDFETRVEEEYDVRPKYKWA